jgi:hypothetical protein
LEIVTLFFLFADINLSPMSKRNIKTKEGQALYEKGGQIIELVTELIDLIPEENHMLREVSRFIAEDAYTLQVKVSGAEAGSLYDIKMECAALIRKAGRELYVQRHNFEMFGYEYMSYMKLLVDRLDEYKALFILWIDTFDPHQSIKDDWGLFNPLGIEFSDENDDIDFDLFDDDDDMDDGL